MSAPVITPEWLVNNTALEDLASRISAGEGLQETPEFRDVNVAPPGMHGELDIGSDPTAPRRAAEPGHITWSGWIKGVDPQTGAWTEAASLDLYYRRVDALIRMFAPRQLVIDHIRPDGVRRAVGYRVGKIAPVRERTSPAFGKFSVTVRIPGAFWSGVTDVTIAKTVATGGAIPLAGLGVGNAPIQDALVTFGPGNNPTLIQGGTYVAYDGVIAAGRELAIETDPANPGVGPGAGALWTPLDSAIRYGPNPTWFEIDPTAGDLVLQHTGGGQMSVQITGRPKYQTS